MTDVSRVDSTLTVIFIILCIRLSVRVGEKPPDTGPQLCLRSGLKTLLHERDEGTTDWKLFCVLMLWCFDSLILLFFRQSQV